MRARGAARDRDRHVRALRGAAPRRASRGRSPSPSSSRSTTCRARTSFRSRTTSALERAVMLKLNGGLGTSMGMTKAKSLLEVKDGLHLPRHHRPPGAPPARAPWRADPAAAHEQLRDPRRHARRARALSRAPDRGAPARLRAGQGAQAARRQPRARRVGGGPVARVGAARARRRVHLARHLGHARHAARARLRVPVPVELGQPGRVARPAHPRPGSRARSCRSSPRSWTEPRRTARAATSPAAARTAASCCARRRRCPTRTRTPSRTSSATATSTPTTSGSTSAR